MSFLTIPSHEDLFIAIKTDRDTEGHGDSPGDEDDDEEEEQNVRLIPRSSPVPRKRGQSIYDEDAEYRQMRLTLPARRVSFADSTGGDLVNVKEFVAFDSDEEDNARWEEEERKYRRPQQREPSYLVRPEFAVPTAAGLTRAVHTGKVEVELVSPAEDEPLAFRGVIRVLNISFQKAVYIRATMDGWGTYFDHPAEYVQGSSDGETDRFSFKLSFAPPYVTHGSRIEFVVRFETPEGHYWANNAGRNYVVTLLLSCEEMGQVSGYGVQEIKSILKPAKTSSMEDDYEERSDQDGGDAESSLMMSEVVSPTPVCPVMIQPEINVMTAGDTPSPPRLPPRPPRLPPSLDPLTADGTLFGAFVSPGERSPHTSPSATAAEAPSVPSPDHPSLGPFEPVLLPKEDGGLEDQSGPEPKDSGPSAPLPAPAPPTYRARASESEDRQGGTPTPPNAPEPHAITDRPHPDPQLPHTELPHTELPHTELPQPDTELPHTELPHTELPHTELPQPDTELPHTELPHTELPHTELPHTELPHPHTELPHTELPHPHTELPHTELPHTELPHPHTELPHTELPHTELPHTELPHTELPHTELPHTELPHPELPHTELPHPELPHTELPHTELPHPHTELPHTELPHTELPHPVTELPHTELPHPHTELPHTELPHPVTELPHTELPHPHTELPHTELPHTELPHPHTELPHTELPHTELPHPDSDDAPLTDLTDPAPDLTLQGSARLVSDPLRSVIDALRLGPTPTKAEPDLFVTDSTSAADSTRWVAATPNPATDLPHTDPAHFDTDQEAAQSGDAGTDSTRSDPARTVPALPRPAIQDVPSLNGTTSEDDLPATSGEPTEEAEPEVKEEEEEGDLRPAAEHKGKEQREESSMATQEPLTSPISLPELPPGPDQIEGHVNTGSSPTEPPSSPVEAEKPTALDDGCLTAEAGPRSDSLEAAGEDVPEVECVWHPPVVGTHLGTPGEDRVTPALPRQGDTDPVLVDEPGLSSPQEESTRTAGGLTPAGAGRTTVASRFTHAVSASEGSAEARSSTPPDRTPSPRQAGQAEEEEESIRASVAPADLPGCLAAALKLPSPGSEATVDRSLLRASLTFLSLAIALAVGLQQPGLLPFMGLVLLSLCF